MILALVLLATVVTTTPDAPPSNPPTPSAAVVNEPPKPEPSDQKTKPDSSQQGTERDPFIVKVIPTPKSDAEASQDAEDRKDKSFSDWWTLRLTGTLALIGIVQTVVFYVQARRLKQTIDTMQKISREQSNDVRESIAQATRAAAAMEGMSAAMLANAAITTEIGKTQREFGQRQMRAYLSVTYAVTVPQDDATGHYAEIRLNLINNGHTPAHEVSYKAESRVLPFPLPDDFDFQIGEVPINSESVIGSGQHHIISSVIRDRLTPDQVERCLLGQDLRMYMWGIAYYKDAFDNPRQTKFSQSVVWMRNGGSMGVNTRRHNEAD